ncbi:MAG: gliding motility protein GldC [Bacteroidetes bacterium]|nr:MAG: gliding motility protein GldC [Bacteroidota bacterium]
MKKTKKAVIQIHVELDEKQLPAKIEWEADGNKRDSKAMLVSFFDRETKETMKIDLWTKDMQIAEMDRFMFQTFRALSDTYFRATQNKELATDMQKFVQYFGEKTAVIPKAE